MEESAKIFDIEEFKVKTAPNTVYYIPNFINNEEEEYLKTQIYNSPKPKWTQLSNRRLQNWGGLPNPKGMISETIPDWLSKYCKKIAQLGVFKENEEPNHILINEYLAGQGIMPHVDGPMYYPTVTTISLGSHTLLDFYKPISELTNATTNKSEEQITDNNSYEKRYLFSLLVEPRSLLVLQDEMYKHYLHGIREIDEDLINNKNLIANYDYLDKNNRELYKSNDSPLLKRQTRISLTIRYVPKILKLNVSNLLLKKKF